MALLEMLQQRLGGDVVHQISSRIGADPGTTGNAIDAALPLLLGAMARKNSSGQNAQQLANAVSKDHDGSILDDVQGFVSRGDTSAGSGILGHILGGRQQTVQNGLSQTTGLEPGKVGQLLTMLAPLVMGAVGRTSRESNLDAGGLSTMLTGEHEHLKQSAPGVMGALGRFLDQDNDGSVMDDVGGMLGKAFGR
jgi:hypothetical protein